MEQLTHKGKFRTQAERGGKKYAAPPLFFRLRLLFAKNCYIIYAKKAARACRTEGEGI